MKHWEFYIDEVGKWRWRCTHQNGNVLFVSAEGYTNKGDAIVCAKHAGWSRLLDTKWPEGRIDLMTDHTEGD